LTRPRAAKTPWGEGPAPYACRPEASRGRLYPEPESATRTVFQRDRDRIIHSNAFRRLKHKTQVFVYHEGDYYRTRLTHSLEVAQIARSASRVLGLDEDLCEALALAHDLGHTPFGHAGEDALNACMAPFGGFDHNAQALRLVTTLEQRYAAFDGLNLTWETLEGLVKHNGPLAGALAKKKERLHDGIANYDQRHDLKLESFASLEAQVASLADDIAYNSHDVDDGLRAGLFTPDDIASVPLAGKIFGEVQKAYPRLERGRLVHECVRRLTNSMIEDLIAETTRNINRLSIKSVDDVRSAREATASFSTAMASHDAALKDFLFRNMYRHFRVNRSVIKAKRIVNELFALFLAEPLVLPPEWAASCGPPKSLETARIVCDYIAGMTDRFAIQEHRRLFAIEASD
jgi:dGTPase